MRRKLLSIALLAASACTLSTASGDRKFTEALDVDYTFKNMLVTHPQMPLDVAMVVRGSDDRKVLQARARIILPPLQSKQGTNVDVPMVLSRAIIDGSQQELLFYVDEDNDLAIDGTREQVVEHIWTRLLAENGVGDFTHMAVFQFFEEKDYTQIGRSIVFGAPPTTTPQATRSCLEGLLKAHVSLEVRVVVNPDAEARQAGLFRTYQENGLPRTDVTLKGIVDAGSTYAFELVFDDRVVRQERLQAQGQDLILPFERWFPATADELARCGPLR